MKIFKSINTLNKNDNFKATIGFVPTMGALHKGHISLIKKSKKKCKKTLVSIFINPTQFEKKDDFKNYPQNLTADINILKQLKVDYLLIPKFNEIYKSKNDTTIKIKNKYKIMCAKYRPGHFEGVLAVIYQFLKKINPNYLFLGMKDYQQLFLIKRLVKKNFSTKIIECKTIRDKKYLPYSSRNYKLSKKNLIIARNISTDLKKIFSLIKKNLRNRKKIEALKTKILKYNVSLEYLEIRNKNNLSINFNRNNFKIFLAYKIQNVRLIDNH